MDMAKIRRKKEVIKIGKAVYLIGSLTDLYAYLDGLRGLSDDEEDEIIDAIVKQCKNLTIGEIKNLTLSQL